jgi:propanediol dehydratase small subunit
MAQPDDKYPLIDRAETLEAASGRPLGEVTLDALDELSIADVQISPATLRAQAEIARAAGFRQLASNLDRAAELTAVPNAELLRMYELLRPQRATHAELLALAEELERRYAAAENARLVREAAEVYRARGLLKRD